MKGMLFLFFTIIVLLSCKRDLNKNTPEGFGEFILTSLIKKDLSMVKKYYANPSDTLFLSDSLALKKLHFWFQDSEDLKKFQSRMENEVDEWIMKAKRTNIKNSDIQFLRVEMDTVENYWPYYEMKIYFLFDRKEFSFQLNNIIKTTDGWVFYRLTPFMTREEVSKEKYKPDGLNFTNCNWEFKYSSPKTFTKFFVTLKNSTPDDFKKIKFRVTIYNNKGNEKTEVFSKIIEKNETVFAGDVVRFEILELMDFYIGFNVTGGGDFGWEASIIDAKPRPGFEDVPF